MSLFSFTQSEKFRKVLQQFEQSIVLNGRIIHRTPKTKRRQVGEAVLVCELPSGDLRRAVEPDGSRLPHNVRRNRARTEGFTFSCRVVECSGSRLC